MKTTNLEFESRESEVNKYMEVLCLLDKGECKIVCKDILGNEESKSIDVELSKILKANTFILLYNLIESTVTNSLNAIFLAIENENVSYDALSKEIKYLWVRDRAKIIKDISCAVDVIEKNSEELVEKHFIKLTRNCVNISGNIDAQEIRKIAKQVGWEETKDGRELENIKKKRNQLAHGEYTFSAIGKDVSIKELIEIKDKTIAYLRDTLQKVALYINDKKYLQIK